jgi:signal transduction histidine kinase
MSREQELETRLIHLEDEVDYLREAVSLLEQSRGQYADLWDHGPVPCCTLDEQGVIRMINLPGARMLGLTRTQLVGRLFAAPTGCEPRHIIEHLKRAKRDGRAVVELPLRARQPGTTIELVTTPLPDGDLVSTFLDVSVRKQASDVLRFQADASRAMSLSLDQNVLAQGAAQAALPFLADLAVVYLRTSEDGWRRAGLAPAMSYPGLFLHPRFHELAERATDGEVLGAVDLMLDLEDPRIDEDARDVLARLDLRTCHVAPLRGRMQLHGVIVLAGSRERTTPPDAAIASDFAERLTLALDNALLHASAVEALRARDQLMAIISHELRTPLGALLMWVEAARRATTTERREKALAGIEGSARMQSRLVSDLVDYVAGTKGKLGLALERVSLAAVATRTCEPLSLRAAAAGIELRVVASPVDVYGDAQRIDQVISNLVTNSLKFTRSGGLVKVSVRRDDEDAVLTVTDDGAGIPPEHLPAIFEPFRQLVPAQSGLGLGLAIARRIVELHGGSIRAHSDGPGHGATFTVRLPALLTGG